MGWIVNCTKPEFREFKRVQQLNKRQPGVLGEWTIRTLGRRAFSKIMLKGASLVMRPKIKKIPCYAISRVVEVSEEEFARLSRVSEEAYGEESDE